MRRLVERFKNLVGAEVKPTTLSVRGLLADDQVLAGRPGVEIVAPDPDLVVYADKARTVNILTELIANGLDHGAAPVLVWTSIEQQHPSAPAFGCIHVRDAGVGVPREQRESLFKPGWTTQATHTGFGLFASRFLANLQGGTIDYADDSPGAHFRLLLPLVARGTS
jgi:two-component system sensor histidine kinase PilS (NtrC family)